MAQCLRGLLLAQKNPAILVDQLKLEHSITSEKRKGLSFGAEEFYYRGSETRRSDRFGIIGRSA